MASGLRLLGTVGAILIFAGFALAGFGYLNEGFAESQVLNCRHDCQFDARNATNATFESETFLGIGFVAGGVGVGCTLAAAIVLMGRWPPPPTAGSSLYPSPPVPPSVGPP
ncbi:MAG TPA: hypothetical protein VK424_03820 [Thermoplasmata archaeon]|nr:hypothetical protein [Thermoplasmata archaeon]